MTQALHQRRTICEHGQVLHIEERVAGQGWNTVMRDRCGVCQGMVEDVPPSPESTPGAESTRLIVEQERGQLAAAWGVRAARLDDFARDLRTGGFHESAQEVEIAARAFRTAAAEGRA